MEHPTRDRPELLALPNGIATGRILLRRYRPGDGESFFAGLAPHRDELMQWMEWPVRHQTVDDSESYAIRMHSEFALRKSMPMGIWDRNTGAFLGGAGFHAPDWTTPKAEIGYFLVPPARGTGIAGDVVRMQVHYAFDQMRVNRIWGGCDAENEASAGVMRRAGLREEGRLRANERDHHGRLRDTLIFGLSVFEFDAWVDAHGLPGIEYLDE